MAELLEYLNNKTPAIATIILALFFLKEPIGAAIKKLPFLADRHFTNAAHNTNDAREFEQTRELTLLKSQLASSKQREEFLQTMTKQSVDFGQEVILLQVNGVTERLNEVEQRLLDELKAIKQSINLLSRRMGGDNPETTKTQEILLKRIEGNE